MEHFITEIRIEKLLHLSGITISLNDRKKQHLMITGKNGSGKTSLLLALQKYLKAINDGNFNNLIDEYPRWLSMSEKRQEKAQTDKDVFEANKNYQRNLALIEKYQNGIDISLSNYQDLDAMYAQGNFITAFFPANRQTQLVRGNGVEDVKLNIAYSIDSDPGQLLHKYMVHLKTQQSYARNEGDLMNAERIQRWFDRFVEALRILLDDITISLVYNYREYDFKIHAAGREPFGFDMLSDGYSSVIYIVSDLILRMDQNWLLGEKLSTYDKEGIVLIDELETHLHIGLQKKIMPFLTTFFPEIQFIITTHSPYILNSISNAKAYDLENCVELEDLSAYSSDGLAEGYFGVDEYSDTLKEKIERYQYLKEKAVLTEEERAERAKLRSGLKNVPGGLPGEARDKFEAIEGKGL